MASKYAERLVVECLPVISSGFSATNLNRLELDLLAKRFLQPHIESYNQFLNTKYCHKLSENDSLDSLQFLLLI
jgi:hypothetical protein